MSQTMSQHMGQHMRLEQRLTPQLIQSMDILQLNVAALENRIADELEKNVTLEVAERGADEVETVAPARDDRTDAESESFKRLETLDREYDLDNDRPYRPKVTGGERDAKMDAMANTASRPEGLYDHLVNQWIMQEVDDETRRAGEAIIAALDPDGYLRTRLDEVAASASPKLPVSAVETALPLIQRLDPVGVAARDYQECLLLQLEQLPGDNEIERALIEKHLMDVVKNRFPQIAKATGYSLGEITEAVKVISTHLTLHPALAALEVETVPVHPDLIIDFAESGNGMTVKLTRGNDPQLRVAPKYAELAHQGENGKEVRDFVKKHLENAKSLIEALKFRRSRLLEVGTAVAERQMEFFEIGPPGLKVLRMSDLAAELNCDPSTISRTVAGKYAQTPRGILPLRYFFTGGPEGGGGGDSETTSWDSIRDRVKQIVAEEDKRHPLNDDQIVAALTKEKLDISRRTVAKYRQQLDIPPARQRRVFD